MRRRIELRDRGLWTLLTIGVPMLVASAVLVWGTFATEVSTPLLDPHASPLVGITPRGDAVAIPPTKPPTTPTPSPQPNSIRVEGVVVDELGLPVQGVCIPIGPLGCREHSPKTDARGVWYFDFPKADVEYDLHFQKDGFPDIVKRIKPSRDQVLNVVLGR